MKSNLEIMRAAKEQLRGKWGKAALACLLYSVVIGAASSITFGVGTIIIAGPMLVGFILFLTAINKGSEPQYETLFAGFNDFVRILVTYLLMIVFIFLWSLLFIIPGIIMSFAYAMTPYILAEDKEIQPMDALRKSRDMMRGYKWSYFCLMLRFFGWLILCCLTFGILLLWIEPYMRMAALNFYNELKAGQEANV